MGDNKNKALVQLRKRFNKISFTLSSKKFIIMNDDEHAV